jgi:hypothetical protein
MMQILIGATLIGAGAFGLVIAVASILTGIHVITDLIK